MAECVPPQLKFRDMYSLSQMTRQNAYLFKSGLPRSEKYEITFYKIKWNSRKNLGNTGLK